MELQVVRVVEMKRGGRKVRRSIVFTSERIEEVLRDATEGKRYSLGDDTYRDLTKAVKDIVRVAYNQGYHAREKREQQNAGTTKNRHK